MIYSLLVLISVAVIFLLIFYIDFNDSLQKNYHPNVRSLKTVSLVELNDESIAERYTLVVSKSAISKRLLVNGTSPGPTLRFKPNKWYEVLVINELPDDFTTIHWHGFPQLTTPYSDGAIGISQCPISNERGKNHFKYSFRAPDFPGAYFYHGHYQDQLTDGLYGAIIVDDRNTADDWVILMADYYAQPAANLLPSYLSPPSDGDEPIPDAVIVNGLFTESSLHMMSGLMENHTVHVINAGSLSMYTVTVDGLPLAVTNIDGTPVEEVVYDSIVVNVAQRTSFVLDFSKLPPFIAGSPSLWFRVHVMASMYPTYNESASNFGILGKIYDSSIFFHMPQFMMNSLS